MSCQIRNNSNIDLTDLEQHIHGMYDHFHQKIGFQKPPTVVFDSDPSNEANVLGKTAYYDPQTLEVHVFTDARHPKDMLRSIAHELIHHGQNLEGRLDVGGYHGPGYYLKNDKLKDLEEEAMTNSAIYLREYEDGLKLKEKNEMSLKEWKNNELNGLLLKKFGILKEGEVPEQLKPFVKGKKSDSNEEDSEEGEEKNESVSSKPEDLKTGRRQSREGAKTQPDRIQGVMQEEVLEEDEVEETVRRITADNVGRHGQGTKEQDGKNVRESVRNALKENRAIRLKIKK